MKIIVVGGGKVAAHLIELMQLTMHPDVVVIESREDVAYKLADQHDLQVIHGNGTDIRLLKMAGAEDADLLIALTGQDETNLVACQIGKLHFKLPQTVARVNNANNMDAFVRLGVDHIYCGTKILADIIDRTIQFSGMRLAYDIPNSKASLIEFYLKADSEAVGHTLENYQLPGHAKLVMLTRPNGQTEIPSGQLELRAGDRLLLICEIDQHDVIWKKLVDKDRTL